MITLRRGATYVGVVAFVIVVWVALTTFGSIRPFLLASPSAVLSSLGRLMATPERILQPIGVTLAETGIAFAIATGAGVILGVVVGSSKLLVAAYEPMVTTLSALPLIILYPVLAATLGVGSPSKVAIGALYGFFPIAISTMRAVARVDTTLLTASRTMGGRGLGLVGSVMIPAISPAVIAAMRVAMSLSLVTIIAAEFISGAAGVGYQLAAASQGLDTPGLFSWVLIVVVLTIVVNILFALITTALRKGIER
ncbi:ABC transporter permease [Microbacterium sp.]|uniref:ABC transporter permease n=1 Tax=Microbacterium sp. TaxID=51671 RepID=UPI003A8D3126